ncbi:MAG TPA: hypothetical protein VMB80_09455, partial [Candidatus Acidoferrum sp.]|nr:hypothetical protein [Candidatus Acidoferrum sp.]
IRDNQTMERQHRAISTLFGDSTTERIDSNPEACLQSQRTTKSLCLRSYGTKAQDNAQQPDALWGWKPAVPKPSDWCCQQNIPQSPV